MTTPETRPLTEPEAQLVRAARDWLDQPAQRTDIRNHTPEQLRGLVEILRGDCESARILIGLALR